MIRTALAIVLAAAVAVTVLALTGEPGHATLVWMGWRADLTAAAAVLLILLAALVATVIWRLLIWIVEAPRRSARARAETRRRQANETLTRGFLAAAAGDGGEARRLALKAADLADEAPGLVRILAAQAAEAAGDGAAAQAAYTAMLGFPEMRLAGHRGLMQLAAARGDATGALAHAQSAYDLGGAARWAWRALLDARLAAGEWEAGLTLVAGALERKILTPLAAERGRAALLAALAAQLESDPNPKLRAQALDHAVLAAKLQPGFAPGVVMAARLLAADGKAARAAQVLEGAWKTAPHPALWLAYRDLNTAESPAQRAARLRGLAEMNPRPRESRFLLVEQALVAGDPAGARAAAEALAGEPLTARIAALMARVAFSAGQADEARAWIARGAVAPQEPDWSDLDPEGRAFAYQREDWARLVASYIETGDLLHPRHERRERTLSDLPDLPVSHLESAPFLAGGEVEPSLYGAADLGYDEDEPPPVSGPGAGQRRSSGRRRLASAPRAAK